MTLTAVLSANVARSALESVIRFWFCAMSDSGPVLVERYFDFTRARLHISLDEKDFVEGRRLLRMLSFLYAFLLDPLYESRSLFEDDGDDEDDYPMFHFKLSKLVEHLAATQITAREFTLRSVLHIKRHSNHPYKPRRPAVWS